MTARRAFDPDHCAACGDLLPCGDSWVVDDQLATERDIALRMHAVQLERANRLQAELDRRARDGGGA